MAGISSKAAGKLENRYKYNGIEFDEDLGIDTYEAQFRNLNQQIGRWWQIDPKGEGQESESPYSSMANNPVKMSDPLGDVPCCKELWADIKSAVKETANAAYNGAVSVARTFNTYVNPATAIVEFATGKSVESDFSEAKPRSISGMEAAMVLVPGLKLEGALINAGEKISLKAGEKIVIEGEKTAATNRFARREAMRDAGIPTSQPLIEDKLTKSPDKVFLTRDKNGVVQNAKNDLGHEGRPHWEAGQTKKDISKPDGLNRGGSGRSNTNKPQIASSKSKVFYNDPK